MTGSTTGERALIISADGHAGAPMREYRPYVDADFRDDFDAYATEYEARMGGSRITPPKHFFNPKVIERNAGLFTSGDRDAVRFVGPTEPATKRGRSGSAAVN